ncbi:Bgt-1573 [Blumeria graminis f. sp. tritici]|uniref:Bgt-1573 n=2 Tax=Blumeria graminis f. sp. tritici TaxID=62690 RepID=A0A061HQH2_BLUGR|nr:Secretory pathway protein Sec39 [Blumeria graminis f. sp. tritici 96224]VCU39809.1 Bgt-1573 [Blumeria graminis f. sp. tritici]
MAKPHALSSAKLILLAVQLARKSDILAFVSLVSQYPRTIKKEILFRILLSYLPETIEPSKYTPLLQNLVNIPNTSKNDAYTDTSILDEMSEDDVVNKVRKLQLIPLFWPHTPFTSSADPLLQFLIHRSLQIDQNTGLTHMIPALVTPFFQTFPNLRRWMISILLPLLRLNYDYYPDKSKLLNIPKFEQLSNRAIVSFLLSNTGGVHQPESDVIISRDLKGLVGPWLYGSLKWKRPKITCSSFYNIESIDSLCEPPSALEKYEPWEEVYSWIASQADISWESTIQAIEGWDGPGDFNLGGFEDEISIDKEDQMHLSRRYAQLAIAVAFSISDCSKGSLIGVQRLLIRVIYLTGLGQIPSIDSACTLLAPVSDLQDFPISLKNLKAIMENENHLTLPSESSIKFLHALLTSASLLERVGCQISVKRAAEIYLQKNGQLQSVLFHEFMDQTCKRSKDDDQYWIRKRNEIHWLRSWGINDIDEFHEFSSPKNGIGIFGQLPREMIEAEFLKLLLSNGRELIFYISTSSDTLKTGYSLARSIYEVSPERPLSRSILEDVVIKVAIDQYDSATNANRSRGGLKRCDNILEAFSSTLAQSPENQKLLQLLQLTSEIEPYRLVLKKGEPFKPIDLRTHGDPLYILGKILEQNPKSYTKILDFIEMAKLAIGAGLIKLGSNEISSFVSSDEVQENFKSIEKRIAAMCIDIALLEDDFETAYSYATTRLGWTFGSVKASTDERLRILSTISTTSQCRAGLDEWSWRASLQVGKYRRNFETKQQAYASPKYCNQAITQIEKCMECISQALMLAPTSALPEILNFYRQSEERLESLLLQAEQQESGNLSADVEISLSKNQKAHLKHSKGSRINEISEEPMTLFDLSRAGMIRAQSGLSTLSMLKNGPKDNNSQVSGEPLNTDDYLSGTMSEPETVQARVRRRDQLKNAAVGGLASGVGWLIGAPSPILSNDTD